LIEGSIIAWNHGEPQRSTMFATHHTTTSRPRPSAEVPTWEAPVDHHHDHSRYTNPLLHHSVISTGGAKYP